MTKLEELVIEEAKLLRRHTTTKELQNLVYEKLEGEETRACIYGQMTGDCRSTRAYELIQQCCNRVYKTSDIEDILVGKLNGKPKKLSNPYYRLEYYASPIENFLFKYKKTIYDKSEKVEKLVKFLKGEIETLEF